MCGCDISCVGVAYLVWAWSKWSSVVTQASGFCYVNDIVIAILELLK